MRNIILSVLGVVLIIGAIFIGKEIANSKKKQRPVPAKVVKTVFTDTAGNLKRNRISRKSHLSLEYK